MESLTGRIILHYKILDKLGQGGMGVVYLAEDLHLERKIAVKFLPASISSNPEERQRFKTEAKAAADLNHPNITSVYSIEEEDNEIFILMEYIKGVELKDKISSGKLQPAEAVRIAVQIAEGLEAAHKKGITHRDIKSSNIMITEDGKIKIMDFGLAKLRSGSDLTKIGTTVGTAAYMSPEQTRGDEVDCRADIWSFGVVLYEMLTGKMPFRGDYDQAIIYSILNEEPEPASEIDESLQHIIGRCLKKNPDNRYQTAGELLIDLLALSDGSSVKTPQKPSKIPWMIGGVMIILIAIAVYLFVLPSQDVRKTDTVATIAVLPFVNMSSDPDQEYFSDGLSEQLINVLSKNPKLRVTGRTSSFAFKGAKTNIKTIARTLNVKNILEGGVQKSGNNLRISADLVNVETEATLWSDTYDGTLDNIFALQDSISGSVAEALRAALLGKEAAQEQKTDPEAYNAYLLGNHFYATQIKEDWEKAAVYYEKALSIDSGYAPAWVGLSIIHSRQADKGYISVDEGYLKARQEIDKALKIDPELGSAYAQLGWIKVGYEWDWRGADEAYNRAHELEPRNAGAISGAALLAATLGRFDEAVKLELRSIEIDPVRLAGYFNLGTHNFYAGFLDRSMAAFRKCIELNPQIPDVYTSIGLVYLVKGRPDSAMAETMMETDAFWKTFGLALANYALGNKKEADNKLSDLIREYQYGAAYQVAEVCAYRNEKDKAFGWLERAYKQRDGGLAQIKGDPLLRNIEKDPRYTAFMKKMKLPD
jgi:serine/threonine protein kinase/Tfp pilus assembly protein PilF